MDFYYGKCLRVIKASFEMRKSMNSSSKYYSDLEAFRRGSNCDTEWTYSTPSNKVILHLFGMLCNRYLQEAGIPLISGMMWEPDFAIFSGFNMMTSSADEEIPKPITQKLSEYENIEFKEASGVLLLPHNSTLEIYRKSPKELEIVFSNKAPVSKTLLSWSGVYGRVRYFPITYMFVSKEMAIGNGHMSKSDNGSTYSVHKCDDVTRKILIGGKEVNPYEWHPFQRHFNLSTILAGKSAIVLEYIIDSYVHAGGQQIFKKIPKHESLDFDFLPRLNDTAFGVMYKTFIKQICNNFGSQDINVNILNCVKVNPVTDSIISGIILVSKIID